MFGFGLPSRKERLPNRIKSSGEAPAGQEAGADDLGWKARGSAFVQHGKKIKKAISWVVIKDMKPESVQCTVKWQESVATSCSKGITT